jgi:predicted transcriptional regulator of viral defense system
MVPDGLVLASLSRLYAGAATPKVGPRFVSYPNGGIPPVDPDRTLAQFSEEHHGIFTTAHARLLGFTDDQIERRLDSGRWLIRLLNSYRLAGVPPSWQGDLLAACWAGGFRAVASHRSAAALWDFAGGRPSIQEITCPRWRRARHDGLVVHESNAFDPVDAMLIEGIPVTTPERTLLDLGAVCHESVVEMALDAAEKRELVTLESVRATVKRLARSGRNGVGTLRRLLDAHSPDRKPTESEMETLLLQVLRRNGFPGPVTQYEIRCAGRFVARVDAAYPEWRIAIEYDSYEYHSGHKAHDKDNTRRNKIAAAGWLPVTATAEDLRAGGPALCAAIRGNR